MLRMALNSKMKLPTTDSSIAHRTSLTVVPPQEPLPPDWESENSPVKAPGLPVFAPKRGGWPESLSV